MFDGVDESLKEQIRSNLLEKYNRGKIDLNSMSTSELKKYIKAEAISIKKNLSNIIRNSNFIRGKYDTSFIEKEILK